MSRRNATHVGRVPSPGTDPKRGGGTPPTLRTTAPQRGFALLITVVLLSFVVMLLVGLAAYTKIETSIAGNTQRQAQAREHALLALNVALGQLQRQAGPDTRVTATAHNFGAINGTRAYTGVWGAGTAGATPLTWLVSGNEFSVPDTAEGAAEGSTVPAPLAVTPDAPGNRTVDLVGSNSIGSTNRTNFVAAPLQNIAVSGVPGALPTAQTVIGRYAWWVGDQGVKAPVAVADTSSTVTYAPYDSADLRGRIRQQMAMGAGAADAAGAVVFEPRDSNNSSLMAGQKVLTEAQLAFARNAANGQLGLARAQQNFHAWSPNNFSVLADTRNGGLRQDLSLDPSLLGGSFAAWVNYPAYMEKLVADPPVTDGAGNGVEPSVSTAPAIVPAYGTDPLRRRYVITPHLRSDNGSHQVAPVLSDFGITFNVRTVNDTGKDPGPLEVRGAWMLSLWNPYTAALVPEDLRMEVAGLPSISVVNVDDPEVPKIVSSFSIPVVFGADSGAGSSSPPPLVISLPWDSTTVPSGASADDRRSWLPGRVYTWRSIEDVSKGAISTDGYPSRFYTRSFVAPHESNQGVQRTIPGTAKVTSECYLDGRSATTSPVTLTVTLKALRNGTWVRIGQFTSPPYLDSFQTTPRPIKEKTYQFGYAFRLKESLDTPANPSEWLTTPTIDFRRYSVQSEAFVVDRDDNPATYENQLTDFMTAKSDRLLFRAGDGYSYNEDVPLFELPRGPLLSLGVLQHFRLWNSRPFMIGNSWGANYQLNNIPTAEIFDRFYLSGLMPGLTPTTTSTGDLILPNPLLKPLRKPDRTKVTIADVQALMTPPTTTDGDGNVVVSTPATSRSSKFFLQGGAFNLNSVNAAAWAAVLRGVRFPAPQSFTYLDVATSTGTAADTKKATVQSGDAQFFRFSQSAQETYKAEPGLAESSPTAGETSPARTDLFRRGMRTLTAAQVGALAAKIVEWVGVKQAADGPFRSMDEFLSPNAAYAGVDGEGNPGAGRSLLEVAIADSGVNAEIPEFSSQWLTQGDIMTALAPVLFPRSDTFMIRAYGEVVNPATNATEGKAWCEAMVQRVPEYMDAAADAPEALPDALTSALNQVHGRRFKVISFRWLTRADI